MFRVGLTDAMGFAWGELTFYWPARRLRTVLFQGSSGVFGRALWRYHPGDKWCRNERRCPRGKLFAAGS